MVDFCGSSAGVLREFCGSSAGVLWEFCGSSAGVLREEGKFVCNVTVFRSTCSKWRDLESGRAGSEDLEVHNCFKSVSLFVIERIWR